MKKITIVGAGNVGAQAALFCAIKNIAEVTLIDIAEGIPQGKALDLQHTMPLFGSDAKILGTNDYADTKNSDIVVITAGLPRKPGMTREDLLKTNEKIMTDVVNNIKETSPNAILIVVTNPLDAMVNVAFKVSGFPKERVIGMGGMLDSTRFMAYIHEKTKESVKNIQGRVMGSHGKNMVVVSSEAKVGEKKLSDTVDDTAVQQIIDRTVSAGKDVVDFLKTGSAFFAPGASIAEMVISIINDEKKIIPSTCYLDGEYGLKDIFIGVPAKLGSKGVDEIIEVELSDKEKETLLQCAENVREQVNLLSNK